jgi:hypothetical protein
MKAHGIDKSNGGGANSAGASGGSGPATPKTPATGGKTASHRSTPASKKRKMAASAHDVDDEDIKFDVKKEIKLESANGPDGSCIIDLKKAPLESSVAGTFMKTCEDAVEDGKSNEDVLLVSESRRDGTAPLALAQQLLLPTATECFSSSVDPTTTLQPLPQNLFTASDRSIRYECGHADYASQTTASLPPDGRHWLHHDPVFFWRGPHLDPQFDAKRD